ncbi:hypothetical protein WOLCODRAFT_156118 [Wolfiporia cocos MD-104 SS10]|uniref:Uncharacterized protein n=1 Tax=Wolfiporia cocos (strain MD-104) TaxID=742152 RepID=A0A2H3IZN2_WOLCO|nr:hypothetical protein WOLCODRAFT_156118 [Wolfiporia cocos MD-104 SS10]
MSTHQTPAQSPIHTPVHATTPVGTTPPLGETEARNTNTRIQSYIPDFLRIPEGEETIEQEGEAENQLYQICMDTMPFCEGGCPKQ